MAALKVFGFATFMWGGDALSFFKFLTSLGLVLIGWGLANKEFGFDGYNVLR